MKLKSTINPKKTIIELYSGWNSIDWMELWDYKDLFYFLILRDIKTRYAQSILGIGWAVIHPLFSMVIFTIVFVNLAKIDNVTDEAPLKHPHSTIQPSEFGSIFCNPYFNKVILDSKLVADSIFSEDKSNCFNNFFFF